MLQGSSHCDLHIIEFKSNFDIFPDLGLIYVRTENNSLVRSLVLFVESISLLNMVSMVTLDFVYFYF